MDHYAKAYPLFGRIRGFYERRFQDMLFSLRRFDRSEVAQQRMKIIKFYEEYGKKATNYLIFYNTQRPHKSLGLKRPMEYLIEKACLRADTHRQGGMSQMYVTYTFT